MEAKLQSKIIRWLKDQGFYVIKTRPGPGMPVGCPDIIALYDNRWLAIEVKADIKSSFRVGQLQTLQHLKQDNRFVYVANPENWPGIRDEILAQFV
jgi:Holliday junction resolvase